MRKNLEEGFYYNKLLTKQTLTRDYKSYIYETLIKNNIFNFNKTVRNLILKIKNRKKLNYSKSCPRSPTYILCF